MTPTSASPAPADDRMPVGIGNAYVFQVFNTISFSVVIGAPMILFFKHLGSSATILGTVAALCPLLNILQIPAARYVEQVGYRSFVLRGWTTRSFFILGMAAVAFLPARIDPATKMVLMLGFLLAYNASRGIATCGFLPWLSQLVPEGIRGQYISRDQLSGALAMFATLVVNALFLQNLHGLWPFGVIFLASFVSAIISLFYLRRIPDVPVSREKRDAEPVPWAAMLAYKPFQKLLIYNFVVNTAFAAGGVFWIPFLRDYHQVTDSGILCLGAASVIVTGASVWGFGLVIDRVGSRPLLVLGAILCALHFLGWGAVAAGILPFNLLVLAVQSVTSGTSGALYNLANTRLIMGTVPAAGRSHFFALISVVNNLTLGLLPIIWGVALDSMSGWKTSWGGWSWNEYSVLYAVLVVTMIAAQYFLHRLSEPRAMTTEAFFHELFVGTPTRTISRLISRRPLP